MRDPIAADSSANGWAAVSSDEVAALPWRIGASGSIRMPQVPKSFISRD
jgi:hypothetical protein